MHLLGGSLSTTAEDTNSDHFVTATAGVQPKLLLPLIHPQCRKSKVFVDFSARNHYDSKSNTNVIPPTNGLF